MFLPVIIDGQFYADGDIVAPMPVTKAKKLSARRILAIYVSAFADTTQPVEAMSMEWVGQDIRSRMLIDSELLAANAVIRVKMNYYTGISQDGRFASINGGRQAALPELRRLGLIAPQPCGAAT